ncbi:hypothetical protein BV25DRAFT_1825070 [Artomyces pyxidatus]|uniref:Uncharacterized protein n=1 Tax=Artomyces pyxidatus TaxID=48021 RepID=A0ACB8T3N2_9AGAM|nr:hypothetical protein BV25DRAFT_1825070 [Artomyces pyxidatus]
MVQLSKFTMFFATGVSLMSRGYAHGLSGGHAHEISTEDPPFAFPIPPITPAQAQRAQVTMQKLAQNSTNQDALFTDVANAAALAAGLTQNFTDIGTRLKAIDNQNFQPQKFFPTWQELRDQYIVLLQDAKNQASAIAGYADEFNNGILVIVNNKDISTASKVAAMEGFVNKTSTFETTSDALAHSFSQLASNLTEFTQIFANFAENRTLADNTKIQTLLGEISQLDDEIAKIKTSMIALGSAMGATVLGTAAGLAFFPEFAPAIIVGAVVIEQILAAGEVALCLKYVSDEHKVDSLGYQIAELREDLSAINAAQTKLNATATSDIPTMASHLAVFTLVWQDVASDCNKLIGWLQQGEAEADMPDVLVVYLDQASTIYTTMSSALTLYAELVTVPSVSDEAHVISHHDEL